MCLRPLKILNNGIFKGFFCLLVNRRRKIRIGSDITQSFGKRRRSGMIELNMGYDVFLFMPVLKKSET